MKAIRKIVHVRSQTIELPELRAFMGLDVEVVVTQQSSHGVTPFDFDAAFGSWPAERDDGLEAAVHDWRASDKPRNLPT